MTHDKAIPSSSALPWCLLLSGAAALIYEVVWLREVSLVMGHTAYALSALLTAFLGGLALGAYIAGRWVERWGASARLYAALEIVVAATALLVPWLTRQLDPAFGAVYRAFGDDLAAHSLAQFGLCALVLLVPTAVMGMTLPVVVHALTPGDRGLERKVGGLYALNSFGGVLGAALAGLLLLPTVGAFGTMLAAAGLNLLAAAFAIIDSFEDRSAAPAAPPAEAAPPVTSGWPAPGPTTLAVLYGLAGMTALALQVGWARLVTLSVGSTVYGFTITLVTFILGLALGSAFVARWRWVRTDVVRALVVLHLVVGIWTIVSLPWLGGLPARVTGLMAQDLDFAQLWVMQLGLVLSTIVVPTLAMGAIFPLVAELLRRTLASSGRAVGSAYAANTLGSIAGSMLAGFVLVPWLGMRGTVIASAWMSGGIALVYLAPRLRVAPRPTLILGAAAVATLAIGGAVVPSWDRDVITSAPFLHGYHGGRSMDAAGRTIVHDASPGVLMEYVEGPTTVATLRALPSGFRMLYIGGVPEAASNSPMHRYLAHQAMLLHGDPKRVLVVGLGVGNTLGAVVQYPVEDVDCLEISPEVAYLAKKHFLESTGLALEDPRVNLVIGDGRSHLRHSGRTYDVIISQPSYPWMAGAARLFTREYFEEIRAHLAPGGVAVVWFPARFESSEHSIMAAWTDVFDEAHLFEPGKAYEMYLAVGFQEPARLDPARIGHALSYPRAAAAARGAGIGRAKDLLDTRIDWPAPVLAGTRAAPANTDDNGFVEFDSFRALINQRSEAK